MMFSQFRHIRLCLQKSVISKKCKRLEIPGPQPFRIQKRLKDIYLQAEYVAFKWYASFFTKPKIAKMLTMYRYKSDFWDRGGWYMYIYSKTSKKRVVAPAASIITAAAGRGATPPGQDSLLCSVVIEGCCRGGKRIADKLRRIHIFSDCLISYRSSG